MPAERRRSGPDDPAPFFRMLALKLGAVAALTVILALLALWQVGLL